MQQQSEPKSRIARDMASWERIEGKLAERYGKRILYDRDFLKAKRDIYRHIRNKYNRHTLNLYEKAEMKVLRGQQRNMLRQLYPNPLVRFIRNMLVFAGNLVALTARAGIAAAKVLFSYPPKANIQYGTAYSPPIQHKKKQSQSTGQIPVLKPVPLQKKTAAQAITRKMPVRSRTQMPQKQTKGVHL